MMYDVIIIRKPPFSSVHTNTLSQRFQKLHSGDRSRKPAFFEPENDVYTTEGQNGEKISAVKDIRMRVDKA